MEGSVDESLTKLLAAADLGNYHILYMHNLKTSDDNFCPVYLE